ncbi:cytosine permease, partial [Streptomyces asiaticus]
HHVRVGHPVRGGDDDLVPRVQGGHQGEDFNPTDYYLVRRGNIDVDALFSADKAGAYYYRKGFNPEAIIAFVPSATVSAVLALVKGFEEVAPFSWVFGMAIAGVIYAVRSAKVRVGGELADVPIPSQVTAGGALTGQTTE